MKVISFQFQKFRDQSFAILVSFCIFYIVCILTEYPPVELGLPRFFIFGNAIGRAFNYWCLTFITAWAQNGAKETMNLIFVPQCVSIVREKSRNFGENA